MAKKKIPITDIRSFMKANHWGENETPTIKFLWALRKFEDLKQRWVELKKTQPITLLTCNPDILILLSIHERDELLEETYESEVEIEEEINKKIKIKWNQLSIEMENDIANITSLNLQNEILSLSSSN